MKYYFTIAALLLNINIVFANGGPIDESFVHKSAHIKQIDVEDIQIISEELNIILQGSYCAVEVVYALLNSSDKEVWIKYGFPVDFFYPEAGNETSAEEAGGNLTALYWQDEYIQDFEIIDDGVKAGYYNKIEPETHKDTVCPGFEYGNMEVETARKWYISNLYFPKNSKKSLKIKYKIKNTYSDAAYTKSYFPIHSDRIFLYDFNPASFWGDGKAKEFKMTIDAGRVTKSGGEVKISGIPKLNEKDGMYTIFSKNFDFKKQKLMKISYKLDNILMQEFIKENTPDDDFFDKIEVSSSVRGFDKHALFDKDIKTPAIILKQDDWIELVLPRESLDFGVIGLINGNTASKNEYYSGARIKELNYEFVYYYFDDQDSSFNSYNVEFEDLKYDKFNEAFFYPFISEVVNMGDAILKPVRIKITVKDLYPGKKSSEVAVPEIIILGRVFRTDH